MKRYRSPVVYVLAALLIAVVFVLKKSKKPSETGPRIEARLAEGRKPRLLDDIRYAEYWAGVGNAVILGGLIVSFPMWGGRRKVGAKKDGSGDADDANLGEEDDLDEKDEKGEEGDLGEEDEKGGKRDSDSASDDALAKEDFHPLFKKEGPARMRPVLFWLLILGAMGLAGFLRWDLAHKSLWVDELLASKQAIVGYFPNEGKDTETFNPATWEKTFFYYSKPRNHVVFSALSRVCHLTWLKITGEPEHKFNEFVFRLPSYIAALLSVALAGILIRRWGLPWAGVLAAIMLAIHPWHIRYGIDGRSYSLTILFILGAMYFLTRALQSGTWRAWIGFALCQMVMLWGSMTTLWIGVLFFGIAFWIIWRSTTDREERRSRLAPLIVVNVFAGMAFIQLMAPNLVQVSRWDFMEGGKSYPALSWSAVGTTIQHLVWGDIEIPQNLRELRAQNAGGILIFIPCFFWGLLTLFRNNRNAFFLTVSVIGAALLFLIFTAIQNYFYYPRFLSYLVVPTVILIGVGAMDIGRILFGGTSFGPPLIIFLSVSLVANMNRPRLLLLMERPIEPIRDVIEFVNLPVQRKNSIIVAYGHGADLSRQYDPSIRVAKDFHHLLKICFEANENGKSTLIIYGHSQLLSKENPVLNHLLRTGYYSLSRVPQISRSIATLQGHTSEQKYKVIRCSNMERQIMAAYLAMYEVKEKEKREKEKKERERRR